MFARVLRYLLSLMEGKSAMPVDPTTGLDVPDLTPAVVSAPIQAVTPPLVPSSISPRPLEQIRSEIKNAHQALKALAAEYRAALRYYDQDCAAFESGFEAVAARLKAVL